MEIPILEDEFYHHFQPIFDIQSGELLGYEGLFRSDLSPEIVFQNAKKKKKLYELDSRSIHRASVTYGKAGYFSRSENLFLNVFPSTLTNPFFQTLIKEIINENGISSQQIILEINEDETFDFETLKNSIFKLKSLGIRIAIDDYGKGFSSIKSVIELIPEFVKLDKYYIMDLNKQKIDVIQFLHDFCEKYNSKLIIEGVEEQNTLKLLKNLGVQYAQGYLLGIPSLLDGPKTSK